MSLYESNESNGKILLSKLFDDKNMDIDGIQSQLTIEKLIFAACRGGWPSSLSKKNDKASLFVANSYVDNICESDVSTVDGIKKDPKKVRALLNVYYAAAEHPFRRSMSHCSAVWEPAVPVWQPVRVV